MALPIERRLLLIAALIFSSALLSCTTSETNRGELTKVDQTAPLTSTSPSDSQASKRSDQQESLHVAIEPQLPGITQGSAALSEELKAIAQQNLRGKKPRSHHLTKDGQPRFVNRLARQDSPYLLQHAHNPVNWYAWGPAAFEKARREKKPIFLSIGYSTCHWCHVMEEESFEDLEVASLLNQHFVAIKVDREVRPDIDSTYLEVVRTLSGRGGWPMSVFLTADKEPFFGGTYFPKRSARGNRPGFIDLLKKISIEYQKDPSRLQQRGKELIAAIEPKKTPAFSEQLPASVLQQMESAYLSRFDHEYGGFSKAPKFPQASLLRFLLFSEEKKARQAALTTLIQMARGGIFDQVGGGFHRYSTDRFWLVPHFEKMLYDNAQLAALYVQAYRISGKPFFRSIAERTLNYLLKEMQNQAGLFYSATDADSLDAQGKSHEGYFFTFKDEELRTQLSRAEYQLAQKLYGTRPQGQFEGRNLLHRQDLPHDAPWVSQELAALNQKLYQLRTHHAAPLLDDKLITADNGLTLHAFSLAALVFDEPKYLKAARRLAAALTAAIGKDGSLPRNLSTPEQKGFLEDYASSMQGLLSAFEATAEARFLKKALQLEKYVQAQFFSEEEQLYFSSANDAELLYHRRIETYDGARPSGNSMMVAQLLRLARLTGDESFEQKASLSFSKIGSRRLRGAPLMAHAWREMNKADYEFFIVKSDQKLTKKEAQLLTYSRRAATYSTSFMIIEENLAQNLSELVPGLRGKVAIRKEATAYLCQKGACQLPTTQKSKLEALLKKEGLLVTSAP